MSNRRVFAVILVTILRPLFILLVAGGVANAHTVTVDGDSMDWAASEPVSSDTAFVYRGAGGIGEHVWRDRTGDERTDFFNPDTAVDLLRVSITGDALNLYVLVILASDFLPSTPTQVQLALDLDQIQGSGQSFFAGLCDTAVSTGAEWEFLVQTQALPSINVIDASFSTVGTGLIAIAGTNIEIAVPWSVLGLMGPPTTPVRFSLLSAREDPASGNCLDVGGPSVANALDVVTDYGDPGSLSVTWDDVADTVLNHRFDVWFNSGGDVYAPLLIQSFLSDSNLATEFIVVRNVSPVSLTLDGFKLGDEESPDGIEGMKSFPIGTNLLPVTDYAVAKNGLDYVSYFGELPDAELSDFTAAPEMLDFPSWASGQITLANAGDQILVLAPDNTILDVQPWGTGTYSHVIPITPVPADDEIFHRDGYSTDTDHGPNDFSRNCNTRNVSNVIEPGTVLHEACDQLIIGPDFLAENTADVALSAGQRIDFTPEFMITKGATLDARVCGQNLCAPSVEPMPDGCHSCVVTVCLSDSSCCDTAWVQSCVDLVNTECSLVCE